jgi:two-component system nitrate/nitrite response regulator NarL
MAESLALKNATILLIDDHALFRAGLQDLLKRRGINVVAAVSSGKEGIALVKQYRPDIVLLDMRMPEMDGRSVLIQIKKLLPKQRVAMLTTSADEMDLIDSLRKGVQGYLLKDMEPDDLVVALKEILEGKTVVAPQLSHVLARAVQGDTLENEEKDNPFVELTPREFEILGLLAEGQSNKVIARNLGIADGTVKLHVKAILRKLQVSSRIMAAVMAVEHGLKASSKR